MMCAAAPVQAMGAANSCMAAEGSELDDMMARLRALDDGPSFSAPAPRKPSFDEVIALQSTAGYWEPTSLHLLGKFFTTGAYDSKVRDMLKSQSLPLHEQVYATLLAILVLQEAFGHREAEWTLMSNKAIEWLRSAGVESHQSLLNTFTLRLI